MEAFCVITSALPDIIGYAEKVVKNNSWGWYNWAHRFNFFWFIPTYLFHVLIDIPAHMKERKYWWHFNVLSWILVIIGWVTL